MSLLLGLGIGAVILLIVSPFLSEALDVWLPKLYARIEAEAARSFHWTKSALSSFGRSASGSRTVNLGVGVGMIAVDVVGFVLLAGGFGLLGWLAFLGAAIGGALMYALFVLPQRPRQLEPAPEPAAREGLVERRPPPELVSLWEANDTTDEFLDVDNLVAVIAERRPSTLDAAAIALNEALAKMDDKTRSAFLKAWPNIEDHRYTRELVAPLWDAISGTVSERPREHPSQMDLETLGRSPEAEKLWGEIDHKQWFLKLIKRGFDLLFGVVVGLICSPFIAIIAGFIVWRGDPAQ